MIYYTFIKRSTDNYEYSKIKLASCMLTTWPLLSIPEPWLRTSRTDRDGTWPHVYHAFTCLVYNVSAYHMPAMCKESSPYSTAPPTSLSGQKSSNSRTYKVLHTYRKGDTREREQLLTKVVIRTANIYIVIALCQELNVQQMLIHVVFTKTLWGTCYHYGWLRN